MFKKITIGAMLAASTLAVAPAPAFADHESRYERSHRDGYYGRTSYRRCRGTTGTIVGGAGGSAEDGAGGVAPAAGDLAAEQSAAGALLGREIAKSSCRSRRY